MASDAGTSRMTTLLALLGTAVLVGAVLMSAHGPDISYAGDPVFRSPPGPSKAAQALDRGDTVLFGAWLGAWPTAENDTIRAFEDATGTDVEIVDIYLDWWTPVQNVTHSIGYVTEQDAVPHLTWEPQGLTTRDILDGNKTITLRGGDRPTIDAYTTEFADVVCDVSERTGDPVLVRPMHEMNGNWFHWGIGFKAQDGSHPNTNDSYKQAWRKLHDAFEAACGDGGDVRLVWAVNHVSVGQNTSFTGAYPGDAYVDYVGIDGYNWGAAADWGWNTFPDLFDRAYCEVTGATDKPVFISEWGSVEQGGDKAAWIGEALGRVAEGTYPDVRAMIWLNDLKREREIGGNVDWRINSSPAAVQAYADGTDRVKTSWSPAQAGGDTSVCT